MKLDNKGITLVEIIISVALIAIVLIFLFTLLIQINNENSDNEIKSSYLVNQSSFIKQIEEDFLDYHLIDGGKCSDRGINIYYTSGETTSDSIYLPRWTGGQIKCLSFSYNGSIYSYGHIFIYERNDGATVLSYYRGDFKQSVELEEFNWDDNDSYDIKVDNGEYKVYSLPIIGPDYNDYSINLSYTS